MIAVARAYGVTKILAFNRSQNRVDFSEKCGADYAAALPGVSEGQEYGVWAESFKNSALAAAGVNSWGVDTVIEVSGAEACMHAGMAFARGGGTCEYLRQQNIAAQQTNTTLDVQVGLGKPINSFPTWLIATKELDVIGSIGYTHSCFQVAIDLLSSGKVNVKPMITGVFPLMQGGDALESLRKNEGLNVKVVIRNQL